MNVKLYSVECTLSNWRERFTDGSRKIFFPAAMYSEQVYYEANGKYHICLARMFRRKTLQFCIIATDDEYKAALDDYLRISGMKIEDIKFNEIEPREGYKLFRGANARGFGVHESVAFDRFGLERIFPRQSRKETVIEVKE